MAHKAKDERHYLAYDGQVGRQQEEYQVVNCVSRVVLVNPSEKVRRDKFDPIEERPESQGHSQQYRCCQHQCPELVVEKLEVLLQFANEDNAGDDKENSQHCEDCLSEHLQLLEDPVVVLVIVFEKVDASIHEKGDVVNKVKENDADCREIEHLLLGVESCQIILHVQVLAVLLDGGLRVEGDMHETVDPLVDVQEHSTGQEDYR